MRHPSPSYRPDIDGLRALAIIPVVLFHAGLLGFTGGFVGVDVFFVISGFLITSIIVRELTAGTFSFLQFWYRRIKRIVPVLTVILASVYLAALFFLRFPSDFLDFTQSLFAQSVFLSNVFFLRVNDYFAAPTVTYPLLHTWSLSVEEQFYILFPLILALSAYLFKKRGIRLAILALGILSFAYNIYLVNIAPGTQYGVPFTPDIWHATNATAGFYLLPTRAWELMLGASLAAFTLEVRSKKIAQLLGILGCAAIVLAVFLITPTSAFPGYIALLPTLGAAAIILAGSADTTFVSKLLSTKPLVAVGKVSYSLYLWHWPIFVFAGQYFAGAITPPITVLLIALAGLLSFITYTFIEVPFHENVFGFSRRTVVIGGISALIMLAGIGFFSQRLDVRSSIPESAQPILAAAENISPLAKACEAAEATRGYCTFGAPGKPVLLLWGDSHAEMLLPLFDAMAKERGISGALVTVSGCTPLHGGLKDPRDPACEKADADAMRLIADAHIHFVVLASRWSEYEQQTQLLSEDLPELVHTLTSQGVRVLVMKEVPPQPNFDVRRSFYTSLRTGSETLPAPFALADERREETIADAVVGGLGTKQVVDPSHILCESGTCMLEKDGVILYRDDNHLNEAGAVLLEPLFTPLFELVRSPSLR